ncbi:hypothetical protein GUJ93_ZPchr0006g45004 [Zizania palustris]|uniref:Retrotransposon gag domain-containing protein n=1 Tax=Zizania palustris TaxID=103762 RepID=A0A8J5SNU9_ZIZPA|nr:hypothetical protein GUJ93_ZPchr0006g45004 [Zizania palustris]
MIGHEAVPEEANASFDDESLLHPDLQKVPFDPRFKASKLHKYSGVALRWFWSLKPGSIKSWEQLKRMFGKKHFRSEVLNIAPSAPKMPVKFQQAQGFKAGDQAAVRRVEYDHGPPLDPRQVNSVSEHTEEASESLGSSKSPSLKPSPEGDVITKMILKDGKEYPMQFSKGLPSEIATSLEEVVKENLDIFAWTDEDIPGVD